MSHFVGTKGRWKEWMNQRIYRQVYPLG